MPVWVDKPDLAAPGAMLTEDAEFPNAVDRERIKRYARLRNLRFDKAEEVFSRIQKLLETGVDYAGSEADAMRRKYAALTYVQWNLLAKLSRDGAERLFLDDPTIAAKDDDASPAEAVAPSTEAPQAMPVQDRLEEILERSEFGTLGLDLVDMGGYYGDVGAKVFRGADGARIDYVDPSLLFRGEDYFPEYASANRDIRVTLFPMACLPLHDAATRENYVLFEIHEPGQVVHRAYRWRVEHGDLKAAPSFADEGNLGVEVDVAALMPGREDYATGLADPTLVIIRNDRGEDAFWGASDYTQALQGIQDEINYKLSALCQHGEKLMAGGITVLPLEMQASLLQRAANRYPYGSSDFGRRGSGGGDVATIARRELDVVFEHGETKDVTRFVSETPHFDGAFQLLEMLRGAFERLSGMTVGPLTTQDAAPESGRALRFKRIDDVARIRRKHRRYTMPIRRVLRIALAMEGIDVPLPQIQWPDAFPLSEQEKAELIDIRTGGKPSLSRVSALMRWDGATETEAEAEIEAIDEEATTPSPIAGVGDFGAAKAGAPDFGERPGEPPVPPAEREE